MAHLKNIYGCVSFFGKMSRITLYLKMSLPYGRADSHVVREQCNKENSKGPAFCALEVTTMYVASSRFVASEHCSCVIFCFDLFLGASQGHHLVVIILVYWTITLMLSY